MDYESMGLQELIDDLFEEVNSDYFSFRNIQEESKKNFNKSKDKVSEDFLREFTRFRIYTGDDDSKVTPSRNGAEIIQENSNSKSSSSREDFGVIAENICNPGSTQDRAHIPRSS